MAAPLSLLLLAVLATAGGASFAWLGLPAPWLAGAMTFCAVAALAGFRAKVPNGLRDVAFVVLGAQIGASFSRETVEAMGRWPLSLVFLALTTAAVVWAGTAMYRRVFRWDSATGFFATMPGALSVALVLAEDARADIPAVAVAQTIRLFALVAILPAIVIMVGNPADITLPNTASTVRDLAVALPVCAVVAFALGRLRVPAGVVLGAAVVNATLHLTNVVTGTMPDWLILPGFVVLGAFIGLRFAGITVTDLTRIGIAGFAGLVVVFVVAATGAVLTSLVTGISFANTLLGFAPGGLEAMIILAFALDLDTAYVGTHQIVRFIGLALSMPIAYRLLRGRW